MVALGAARLHRSHLPRAPGAGTEPPALCGTRPPEDAREGSPRTALGAGKSLKPKGLREAEMDLDGGVGNQP